MAEQPRGGLGTWCPDCGQAVAVPGQIACVTCGLELQASAAREVEQANAQLHQIARNVAELEATKQRWLTYRSGILARAPRREMGSPPPPPPEPFVEHAAAPPLAAPAPLPFANPQAAHAVDRSAPAPESVPASPMRAARNLPAATLLGVAGAALVILAGIIFVAASWTDYGPLARMYVLVGFAGVFAWLGWTSQRHHFPTIGGAIAVVSAAFAGVAVYAARTGPDGVEAFTFPVAVVVAAVVAKLLAWSGLRAVGLASAGALALAVEAGALEAAVRADDAVSALALHSLIAALGAAAVMAASRLWSQDLHRDVAAYSGIAVAFAATVTGVLTPFAADSSRVWIVLSASLVSLAVCGGVAAWRPRIGTGVLTFALSWSAMAFAAMWSAPLGVVVCVGVVAAAVILVLLGRRPASASIPGLWGLLPLVAAVVLLAGYLVVGFVLPNVLGVGMVGSAGTLVSLGSGGTSASVWWASGTIIVASLSFLILERWRDPLPLGSVRGLPAIGVATGTVALAVAAARATPVDMAATSAGLTLAAVAQWGIASWWHADVRAAVYRSAAVIATVGGIHAAVQLASATWAEGSHDVGRAWVSIGALALSAAVLSLASLRVPQVAAVGLGLVVTAGAAAGMWSATRSPVDLALAVMASAIGVVALARGVPRRVGIPLGWGAAPMAAVAALIALAISGVSAGSLLFVEDLSVDTADAWRGLAVALAAALAAPLAAPLWSRDAPESRERTVVGVAGPALVAATVMAVAWTCAAIGNEAVAYAPVIAAAAAAIAHLVAYARPWRAVSAVTWVSGTVIVTAQSFVVLAHVAAGTIDRVPALGSVTGAVCVLAGVAWRRPLIALAPAVAVGTLAIPTAVLASGLPWALWSAVMTVAGVAWCARLFDTPRRRLVWSGGLPVTLAASALLPVIAVTAARALAELYGGNAASVDHRWWTAEVAAVLAAMSFPHVRARAAWLVAPALAVMAGLVPAPVGWIGLAAAGLIAVELTVRFPGRAGLRPTIAIAVGSAAVVWSGIDRWALVSTLGAVAVAALWLGVRSGRALGHTWLPAWVIAPAALAPSLWLAGVGLGLDRSAASVVATGAALTVAVVAVVARREAAQVAPFTVSVATVIGASATADPALAGVVVFLSCAAWYSLSVWGISWARWVALGGLSVVAALLLGSVGVTTLEAYTAVPAATFVGLGLWWLRKDPQRRTYEALAPGLAVALVPSYLAVFAAPQALLRPLLLAFAALLLAIVGVARRWFAPLVATAVTAVVLAVGQIVAHDALVPKWVAFAFVGGVILALGLVAERISKMR